MLASTKGWIAALVTTAFAAPALAVSSVTFDLQNQQLAGTNATVEVHVNFASDEPLASLDAVQLSVLASDAALQTPDYSRFSFVGASGWSTIFDFADLNLGVAAIWPDTLPGPGPGSDFLLGTLSIDLSGLPSGQYVIDISGGVFDPDRTSSFGAVTPGEDSPIIEVPGSFSTSSVSFVIELPDGNAIPEPATAGLGVLAIAGVAAAAMRRRR